MTPVPKPYTPLFGRWSPRPKHPRRHGKPETKLEKQWRQFDQVGHTHPQAVKEAVFDQATGEIVECDSVIC